jgi:1-deoxy-D-xylulose-5-phosphate reductoisomerase
MAGELVTSSAQEHGARLVPVDSEHSAIWQCLRGEDLATVQRLILTASGGPFRTTPLEEVRNATVDRALAHPNWRMGPKVTIDSATMMNKGLEVIEAHYLFGIPYERIDVVIHSQSTVHSAVQFQDGTLIAQMGVPDMRAPIALAMSNGRRLPGVVSPLRLAETAPMDFAEVELERFPALAVAREAALAGGAVPAAMNAANEVAVAAFLNGRMRFGEIAEVVSGAVAAFSGPADPDVEAILAADQWARQWTLGRIAELAGERPPALEPK